MLYVMMLAIVVGTALVIALVPESPTGSPAEAEKTTHGKDADGRTGSASPQSLEGVLVSQLSSGEINRRQYVREMERLAARDDKRHPLVVPPDLGSAAA
ncbi:hypothetical protein C8E87_0256 [Paractinoplanes brasiliensis]|uniref:Uncharacterized protein n=2 Tax=Paractinoplanes brasiliensis TaxID=52695 RepID=A0A4R6JPY4_9ACTN|nr:hypothetical protein C8E87_0256 [Actinoplanes brasiliensis]